LEEPVEVAEVLMLVQTMKVVMVSEQAKPAGRLSEQGTQACSRSKQ
jgi:hypothetical protein